MVAAGYLDLLLWLVPLLAVAGLFAGVLAGLLGVGGGIVVVPVLYHVFGLVGISTDVRMHLAVGTSLAVIVPTSIRSVRAHARRGGFDPLLFRRWWPAMLAGALLGTWLAMQASFQVLTSVFAVVALAMSLQLSLGNPSWRLGSAPPAGVRGSGLPAVIGALSAMMGIGGGTLTVPVLTLFGVPIHRAVGTSSGFGVVISIPAAIGFAAGGWADPSLPRLSLGYISVPGLVLLVPATLLTVPLGARLAHGMSQVALRRAFALFLAVTAGRMLWDVVRL